MKKQRKLTQVLAAALLLAYVFQNVALAHAAEANLWDERRSHRAAAHLQLANLPSPLPSISLRPSVPAASHPTSLPSIPDSLRTMAATLAGAPGSVREVTDAPGADLTVIHVQDIHRNAEAQANIATTLTRLIEERQIDLVALEGAFGDLDFSSFRSFEDRDLLEKTADYLLSIHAIPGPVHAALTVTGALPPIVGVDDAAAYERHVGAVKAAEIERPLQRARWKAERADIARAKAATFSAALAAFDADVQRRRNGELDLGAYARRLADASETVPDEVRRYLEALELESDLDFKTVESERTRLVARLSRELDDAAMTGLLDASFEFRAGRLSSGAFHRHLTSVCAAAGIELHRFPSFSRYVSYVLLADRLEARALFAQLQRLEEALYERRSRTPAERALVARDRRHFLTGKLIDFALTPDEWEAYRQESDPSLASFESFYREAEARDRAMAVRLLAAARRANAKTAVLVTGGFHAAGIQEILARKNVSILSFAPRLTTIDGASGAGYLSVFTQEKAPLERLVTGEKLFLSELIEKPGRMERVAGLTIGNGFAWSRVSEPVSAFRRMLPGSPTRIDSWRRDRPGAGRVEMAVPSGDSVVLQVESRPDLTIVRHAEKEVAETGERQASRLLPISFLTPGGDVGVEFMSAATAGNPPATALIVPDGSADWLWALSLGTLGAVVLATFIGRWLLLRRVRRALRKAENDDPLGAAMRLAALLNRPAVILALGRQEWESLTGIVARYAEAGLFGPYRILCQVLANRDAAAGLAHAPQARVRLLEAILLAEAQNLSNQGLRSSGNAVVAALFPRLAQPVHEFREAIHELTGQTGKKAALFSPAVYDRTMALREALRREGFNVSVSVRLSRPHLRLRISSRPPAEQPSDNLLELVRDAVRRNDIRGLEWRIGEIAELIRSRGSELTGDETSALWLLCLSHGRNAGINFELATTDYTVQQRALLELGAALLELEMARVGGRAASAGDETIPLWGIWPEGAAYVPFFYGIAARNGRAFVMAAENHGSYEAFYIRHVYSFLLQSRPQAYRLFYEPAFGETPGTRDPYTRLLLEAARTHSTPVESTYSVLHRDVLREAAAARGADRLGSLEPSAEILGFVLLDRFLHDYPGPGKADPQLTHYFRLLVVLTAAVAETRESADTLVDAFEAADAAWSSLPTEEREARLDGILFDLVSLSNRMQWQVFDRVIDNDAGRRVPLFVAGALHADISPVPDGLFTEPSLSRLLTELRHAVATDRDRSGTRFAQLQQLWAQDPSAAYNQEWWNSVSMYHDLHVSFLGSLPADEQNRLALVSLPRRSLAARVLARMASVWRSWRKGFAAIVLGLVFMTDAVPIAADASDPLERAAPSARAAGLQRKIAPFVVQPEGVKARARLIASGAEGRSDLARRIDDVLRDVETDLDLGRFDEPRAGVGPAAPVLLDSLLGHEGERSAYVADLSNALALERGGLPADVRFVEAGVQSALIHQMTRDVRDGRTAHALAAEIRSNAFRGMLVTEALLAEWAEAGPAAFPNYLVRLAAAEARRNVTVRIIATAEVADRVQRQASQAGLRSPVEVARGAELFDGRFLDAAALEKALGMEALTGATDIQILIDESLVLDASGFRRGTFIRREAFVFLSMIDGLLRGLPLSAGDLDRIHRFSREVGTHA